MSPPLRLSASPPKPRPVTRRSIFSDFSIPTSSSGVPNYAEEMSNWEKLIQDFTKSLFEENDASEEQVSLFTPARIGYIDMKGPKRVNVDDAKDKYLAKRGKAEGKVDGTQEEEREVDDKVERQHKLLKYQSRHLSRWETHELIHGWDVDDIIRWALKWWRVGEQTMAGYLCLEMKPGQFVPSTEKVGRLMSLMLLCGVEKLKAVDLYILHNNFPKPTFACILLRALESYSKRHPDADWSWNTKEKRDDICKACCVFSWKLLAHVMYKLTSLPVFKCAISTFTVTGTSEGRGEEEIQKEAAEKCNMCKGKGKHRGVYGDYCSYFQYVPCGVTVETQYAVVCKFCVSPVPSRDTLLSCRSCGGQAFKVDPISSMWDPFM